MAEQISRRAQNVTSSQFEGAFETSIVRFGSGSLNLKESLDAMDGWSRHTNIWHRNEGEATARPGQTAFATFPAGALTKGPLIQLAPAAAFWEAMRRGIPPRPSLRAGVDGWFPHISATGQIVSGSGQIWLDGVYLDVGWTPKWIDTDWIVYNTGSASRIRNVTTGSYTDVALPANRYAGDPTGGGAWQMLRQTGAIEMARYTGRTTLAASYTGRGNPAIAPTGSWGNSDNYFGASRTAYRDAAVIAGGLEILDVSLSTTHSCLCIATGTYTRSVKVYPGGTENAIQSWEAPLILDGPDGEPWILSLWQTGLVLRPAGSHVGYYWPGGEWYNPCARYVGDHFLIAASTGSGVPHLLTVDPDSPRIDLVTFGPGPGPDPEPDPGPDPGPIGEGTTCHSIRKLRDPHHAAVTRVWGVDTTLRIGLSGAVTPIDSGYSGDPLTLLPHRPTLSGDPWMFVADRSRMRKVRADGLDIPIGLPAPNPPTYFLEHEFSRAIDSFGSPGAWTPAPGQDWQGTVVGTPDAPTSVDGPIDGTGMLAMTNPGTNNGAYDSWWGQAVGLDLTVLDEVGGDSQRQARDEDICHIWMQMTKPGDIAEVRLYVVVSEVFDPLVLPGTGTGDNAGKNTDAYVKAFRPNDYTPFVQAQTAQIDAAEQARVFALRDADAKARAFVDSRDSWEDARAASDPGRARGFQLATAAHQWFGIGMTGSPFRRGDFLRLGSDTSRDWATVTGLIVYVRTIQEAQGVVGVGFDDWYFTGGFGPDTCEPGAQAYDYRITHYDPRTGCESNGSADLTKQEGLIQIDTVRRHIRIDPIGYGDSSVRQRIYRRGGSLIDDWYYVGETSGDGASFTDIWSDDEIVAAGTIPTDHYQPVPTVDDRGNTVLAQAVPALWGPVEGMLFACGDPYRPGHAYFSVAGEPDHWSAFGNVEVCAPSEELMHGGVAAHQAFVFSRLRLYFLYPNLTGQGGVTAAAANCTRGLLGRWAMAVGPGGAIYFVAEDGVFVTDGGSEAWLSEAIDPLFYGTAVNGYLPIDKTAVAALRLTCWETDLYFQYQDSGGARQVLVYSLVQKFWRHYHFGRAPAVVQGEDEELLLLGGASTGAAYSLAGTSDDGSAIACAIRTGSASGGRREEKLYGDLFLDVDSPGVAIDVQVFLNEEMHINLPTAVTGDGLGRQRFLLDAFGVNPQKAHSIACELRWSTTGPPPTLFQLGYAITLQPDVTSKRVTNWDDLNSPDEVWLTGVTLDCDTAGGDKRIIVERDFNGTRTVVDTFLVNSANRHKFKFSWLAVPAHMVRIRPDPNDCTPWLLYRADWIYLQEPPRISAWDIHFENQWDQYYTGLDLYCDTRGAEKRIEVWVDEVRLLNTLGGGLTYWPVVADGRRVVHLTLPWGRGHVFRFFAIDGNPGLLYTHRWHLQAEPSEQANWNQNFSILGTRADKWLKAIVLECDTYGAEKQVQVEVDGTVVETLLVQTAGRRVVHLALQTQHLGRVWRIFPVDGNPGRLYSAEPLFDEEPFQLNRWETQETNHGLPGWFYPLYAHLTLKSTADVTLTTVVQHNQVGDTTTHTYAIPATGGVKQRRFLAGFHAVKGVLIKYLLTSPTPFWLYRDETTVVVQPWGAARAIVVQPFGNDDQDPSRPMTHAVLAAQASGGGADAAG